MEPEVPRFRSGAGKTDPRRRLRKGMYILPSLFTTANIAAGLLRDPAGHARHGRPNPGILTTRPRPSASPFCSTVSTDASRA